MLMGKKFSRATWPHSLKHAKCQVADKFHFGKLMLDRTRELSEAFSINHKLQAI